MTEKVEIKLINETDKYYEIETPEGKRSKAFKIDTNQMDEWHRESIMKVAKAFDDVRIKEIIKWLEKIINNIPTVETYLDIVTDLAEYLNECYDVVGSPNLFHYPFKYINPEIYGKAGVLMKRVVQLHSDMLEVAMEMAAMGKLQSVETSNEITYKYTIYVREKDQLPQSAIFEATEIWILRNSVDRKNYEVKTEIA